VLTNHEDNIDQPSYKAKPEQEMLRFDQYPCGCTNLSGQSWTVSEIPTRRHFNLASCECHHYATL